MRIALVAMSGVRVRTPSLQALGVTLPGFVERGRVIASLPSLALLTVAALTPPEDEVAYFEVADLAQGPDLTGFDLVALSTYTAQAYEAYRLADACRRQGIPVVIGGLHATVCPEEARAHADAVAVGEAEGTWPRLLEDFRRGALKPCYRPPGAADLSASPVPRYGLLETSRYNRITLQTHRGCPHDCRFCGSSRLYGRGFRQKEVAQVLRELEAIEARWRGEPLFVELADDNSFVDPAWTGRFLDAMADRGVSWFTETDVSIAERPELLGKLSRAGCRQVLIGFESPGAVGLEGIDSAGWKRRRQGGYREAIRRIQDEGVSVNGCFILGKDTDGPESFEEVGDFVESSGLTEVQATVMTPFPGTALYRDLAQEGRLLERAPWERCTLFDVVYRPRRMSVEQLQEGFEGLLRRLYGVEGSEHRKALRQGMIRRALRESGMAGAPA